MDSLQKHAEEVGSSFKIIGISHETIISKEEKEKGKCSKCDNEAKYFCNFIGKEKLLCEEHATIFRRKNSELPKDMWFCNELCSNPDT
mgnify:CR=1 FL=1|jgi:hypothetical protein